MGRFIFREGFGGDLEVATPRGYGVVEEKEKANGGMVLTRSQKAAQKRNSSASLDVIGWGIVAVVALITHLSSYSASYPLGKSCTPSTHK